MTLFWLAAAFIIGVFLGFSITAPGVLLIGLGVAAIVAAAIFRRRGSAGFSILVLGFFLLGAGRSEFARVHLGPGDIGYYDGRTVTLTGYVNTEPDTRDTGNNYVISVQSIQLRGKVRPISGEIELHTAAAQLFNEGDDIQLTGMLVMPTNSPSIPYRSILANRGIYSEMAFPKGFVVGHVSLGLVGVADSVRTDIQNIIKSNLPEPEATFLIALLIGARSAQLGALAPVLIRTGLIHLIAISGIKVAIVAGTLNDFLRVIASRTPRLLLSSALLLAYWLISGATVAGLRASIVWLLIFMATYLGRPSFGLVSLGIAAALMLAVTPSLLWDTSFQLTTVGTAGILLFSPFLDRLLRWTPSALRASVSTTFAAQVAVFPIQIASFGIYSPVSILANALVLPLVPLTMIVGFLSVLAPGSVLTTITYGLVHAIIATALWADTIAPAVTTHSIPSLVVIAFYAVLIAVAVGLSKFVSNESRSVKGEWLVGFAAAAIGLGVVLNSQPARDGIYFPVNGSTLITWHGRSVLIDGGAKPSILLTALGQALSYPSERLAAVIDTSPQAKNVAALTDVVRNVPVDLAIDPGLEYPSQTYARWRAALLAKQNPTVALRPGLVLNIDGLLIRCLAPDGIYSNPKNGAGILMISIGRTRILYLGDAAAGEQDDVPFTQNVRATAIISSVPVDPILSQAAGNPAIIRPLAGHSLNLARPGGGVTR